MKTALITGATSGFGKAIAEEFHNRGYKVFGFGRNIPAATFNGIEYHKMDVTDENSVNQALKEVFKQIDKVDVLVNCAGHGIAGPSEEIPMDQIKEVFEVNFFGTVRVTNKVLPYLRKSKAGRIINFSSIAGYIGLPFQAYYSATKHAMEGYTESLSIEVKPFNIKVLLIQPGDYNTNAANNKSNFIPPPESIYHERLKYLFQYLSERVNKGSDPQKLAKSIVRLSELRKPKLRHKFGTLAELSTKLIHAVIPARYWEKVMEFFYRL